MPLDIAEGVADRRRRRRHEVRGLAAPAGGTIYVPWPRVPTGVSHLVVRTTGDPTALAPAVRDLVRSLRPALPVPEVRSLADHVAGSIAERRVRALPAAGFAALALAVAMVGLFGTLARAVVERRQELAIRAAVGAAPGRLVLRNAFAVTGLAWRWDCRRGRDRPRSRLPALRRQSHDPARWRRSPPRSS